MKRVLSFFLAVIMAATIFYIPAGFSYAEESDGTNLSSESQPSAESTAEVPASKVASTPDTSVPVTDDMITLAKDSFVYTGAPIKPKVSVINGESRLKEGSHYTLTYSNNTEAGTAVVRITGKGNYSGKATKTFQITPANLKSVKITTSYTDYNYTKRYRRPSVTVKLNGNTVSRSNYSVKYSSNKYPGTATIKVTGKNSLTADSKTKTFYIARILRYKVHKINNTSLKISWSGEKNVTGYVVERRKSGDWVRLKTVKGSSNTDCTLTGLSSSTAYKLRVRAYVESGGKRYYGSSRTTLQTHTRPNKAVISSVNAYANRSAKVVWKKQRATGYQVQLSRYSNFKKASTYKLSSSSTSKRFTKLTDGRKYYVRVRAYKTTNGKTVYGAWSRKKSFRGDDTGWMTKDGSKYYYSNGKYLTGTRKLNGSQYYFSSKGKWLGASPNMWSKIKNESSETKWLIAVSRDLRRVVVYRGEKGDWKPKYYWKCTVGTSTNPTPTGSFTVPEDGENNRKYTKVRMFGHGYSVWYATRIRGSYMFHSVLYQPGSQSSFVDSRLGMALSLGCIRLSIKNALWIYRNIKPGTKVVIY